MTIKKNRNLTHKNMIPLFLISETISQAGYYEYKINKDNDLVFNASETVAYVISQNSFYNSLSFTYETESSQKIVYAKDASLSNFVKIENPFNLTLKSNQELMLYVYVLESSTCSSVSLVAQANSNFGFTVDAPGNSKLCIFPFDFNDDMNITINGTFDLMKGNPTSKTFESVTATDGMKLSGFYYIVNKASSFSMSGVVPKKEDTDCLAVPIKILKDGVFTNGNFDASYTMNCSHSIFEIKNQAEEKLPWAVIIGMMILVIFCIASGIYALVNRNKGLK